MSFGYSINNSNLVSSSKLTLYYTYIIFPKHLKTTCRFPWKNSKGPSRDAHLKTDLIYFYISTFDPKIVPECR